MIKNRDNRTIGTGHFVPKHTKSNILLDYNDLLLTSDKPVNKTLIYEELYAKHRVSISRIEVLCQTETLDTIKSPKKTKQRPLKYNFIDNDLTVIDQIICDFNANNINPYVIDLYRSAKSNDNYDLSFKNCGYKLFCQIIKRMNYKYTPLRKVIREEIMWSPRITQLVKNYLILKSKYEKSAAADCAASGVTEGGELVFIDEVSFESNDTKNKVLRLQDPNKQMKTNKTIGIGTRYNVIHAIDNDGFIPNAEFIGDKNTTINAKIFEEWAVKQLIPNLKPHSIVCFDNSSVHSRRSNKAPVKGKAKKIITDWLDDNGISYNKKLTNDKLLEIVRQYAKPVEYNFDNLLRKHGHYALRLPAYHCELNDIETCWAISKNWIRKHSFKSKPEEYRRLISESFNNLFTKSLINDIRRCVVRDFESKYIQKFNILDFESNVSQSMVSGLPLEESQSSADCLSENKSAIKVQNEELVNTANKHRLTTTCVAVLSDEDNLAHNTLNAPLSLTTNNSKDNDNNNNVNKMDNKYKDSTPALIHPNKDLRSDKSLNESTVTTTAATDNSNSVSITDSDQRNTTRNHSDLNMLAEVAILSSRGPFVSNFNAYQQYSPTTAQNPISSPFLVPNQMSVPNTRSQTYSTGIIDSYHQNSQNGHNSYNAILSANPCSMASTSLSTNSSRSPSQHSSDSSSSSGPFSSPAVSSESTEPHTKSMMRSVDSHSDLSARTSPTDSSMTVSGIKRKSPSPELNDKNLYKLPFGKEGSRKHRILKPLNISNDRTCSPGVRRQDFLKRVSDSDHNGYQKDSIADQNNCQNMTTLFHQRRKSVPLTSSHKPFAAKENSRDAPNYLVVNENCVPNEEHERHNRLQYPMYFQKGSIIKLGNGEVKRVEDMSTQDFIDSASDSQDVVDISTRRQIFDLFDVIVDGVHNEIKIIDKFDIN